MTAYEALASQLSASDDHERCPVCGDGIGAFALASRDLYQGVPGTFTFLRCCSCKSVYQVPRTDENELGSLYPDSYFTHEKGAPISPAVRGSLKGGWRCARQRLWLTLATEHLDQGSFVRGLLHFPMIGARLRLGMPSSTAPAWGKRRCLEVGPGLGGDSSRLSALGWMVEGVDVDPTAARHASERSGLAVHVGTVGTIRPQRPYELIYGHHVLEHMPDTAAAIADMRRLLAADGRMIMVYPNPRSLCSILYRALAVTWDPPRHQVLPSVAGLRALLYREGFHKVRIRTTPKRASHYSAIARTRMTGIYDAKAWEAEPTVLDHFVHYVESVLVLLGIPVGEEIVVIADDAKH